MAKTHLPIDAKTSKTVCGILHPLLFDLIELKLHVKAAHWNLRSENFLSIHRLLDEIAELVDDSADEVAERIRQLGEAVDGSSKLVSSKNRLPSFPVGVLDATEAIEAVCQSLQAVIKVLREGIDMTSEDPTEPITADLLTQVCGKLELHLWLLNSHLA
jgi:starvation-inducible DNA-binding protein